MSKRTKTILWTIGAIIGVLALAIIVILVWSSSAVSTFRSDASSQLNPIISGKNSDISSPVKLQKVPFADTLDATYKKTDASQKTYAKILTDARNYNFAKKYQDALANIYNENSQKNAPISPDILTNVDAYLAVLKNDYPSETSRISQMENLANLVIASANFSQINNQMANVIQSNSTWLNEIQVSLNAEIANFQNTMK